MTKFLFIAIAAIVFIVTVQLVKKLAPVFYAKIANFVPLILFAVAVGAAIVFNLIVIKKPDLGGAVLIGYFIASTGVYTYEGVTGFFKKVAAFFKKTNDDVMEAVDKKRK